jgi:hypothetical protein
MTTIIARTLEHRALRFIQIQTTLRRRLGQRGRQMKGDEKAKRNHAKFDQHKARSIG